MGITRKLGRVMARAAGALSSKYGRPVAARAVGVPNEPSPWCPHCRTSLTDTQIRRVELPAVLVSVAFARIGRRAVAVTTARPELLCSCVALCTHPRDERNIELFGTTVRVPLFGHTVPVWTSSRVDSLKDGGVIAVCTFGGPDDIKLWRAEGLPVRLVFGAGGDMNGLAGMCAGMKAGEARRRTVAALEELGLIVARRAGTRVAMVHARCETEAEFVMAE